MGKRLMGIAATLKVIMMSVSAGTAKLFPEQLSRNRFYHALSPGILSCRDQTFWQCQTL